MKWIFPMSGKGTRTKELGEFKLLIKIGDFSILSWFLKSIRDKIKEQDTLLFITTEYFEEKFKVKQEISNILKELSINNSFDLFTEKGEIGGASLSVHRAKEFVLNFS